MTSQKGFKKNLDCSVCVLHIHNIGNVMLIQERNGRYVHLYTDNAEKERERQL